MKKFKLVVILILMMLVLTSCFPGTRAVDEDPAGFFWGILHGWIAPFSLILSIFKDDVAIYESLNIGFWYDFGFYIAILGGFGGLTLSRKRKKDD